MPKIPSKGAFMRVFKYPKVKFCFTLFLLALIAATLLYDCLFYINERKLRNAIDRNCRLYGANSQVLPSECFENDELSCIEMSFIKGVWHNGFPRTNSARIIVTPIDNEVCILEFQTGVCTKKILFSRLGHLDKKNKIIVLNYPMSFYPDFKPFKCIHILHLGEGIALLPHLTMFKVNENRTTCSLDTSFNNNWSFRK